jgi:hypothetical protein
MHILGGSRQYAGSAQSKRYAPRKPIKYRTAAEETELHDSSLLSAEDRLHVERSEQAFFDQKGFVTDSMPEVDASKELLRMQKEAKARNREDRIKSDSLD